MAKKQLIKIVVPGDGDYLANEPGGGSWKPVKAVTKALRRKLAAQVDEVLREFAADFARWKVPGVAVVSLHDKAIAKTKRPKVYFNSHTCPVIGYGDIGELRVSVTPRRLALLKDRLLNQNDTRGIAHISTIEDIRPFRLEAQNDNTEPIKTNADRGLRLRLFRHLTQPENFSLIQAIRSLLGSDAVTQLNYAKSISILSVRPKSKGDVATLQSFIGTQSLCNFPSYSIADAASTPVGEITDAHCPPPDPEKIYAVIGQFDSGTSLNASCILPWVRDRHSWYPRTKSDTTEIHSIAKWKGGRSAAGQAPQATRRSRFKKLPEA